MTLTLWQGDRLVGDLLPRSAAARRSLADRAALPGHGRPATSHRTRYRGGTVSAHSAGFAEFRPPCASANDAGRDEGSAGGETTDGPGCVGPCPSTPANLSLGKPV